MDFTMYRGDSHIADIPLEDSEGSPMSLEDVTVIVTAKSSDDEGDESALFQHWIAFDAIGDPVEETHSMYLRDGGIVHRIDPDESATFQPGVYQYDVQVNYPSPIVPGETETETKIQATMTVIADITRMTEAPAP